MQLLRKEIRSMQTSSLDPSSARLLQVSSSHSPSEGRGHQQSNRVKHLTGSRKCIRAWVRLSQVPAAHLLRVPFHRLRMALAMYPRHLPAA